MNSVDAKVMSELLAELDGLDIETQPQRVKRRSRDFYWYSPILKRQLDAVTGDAVITPKSEAEIVRIIKACFAHEVPLTVRGGGTGNYGQAMPLKGGVILDLFALNDVLAIGPGWVQAQAGATLIKIDQACQIDSGQELRLHPSTRATGTLGGYIAGGSSGIGSVTYGLLRDPGNIIRVRVVTMEAEPKILTFEGRDIQKVNHAYGTNGIITELTMPLAPAYPWREAIVGFKQFMAAAEFADHLAKSDGILKKLVCVQAAPIGHDYLLPELVPKEAHCVMVMVADVATADFLDLVEQAGGQLLLNRDPGSASKKDLPIYEYSWNHTTLHALKHDRTITYLQTLFPPPAHLDKVAAMVDHFGDEVPMHLEFVRFGGQIACFGLQIVRFSTEERLQAIIDYHNQHGCPIFNPHDYTLEGGGMKHVDPTQLAFKREADPKGLLNPGKMIGWDNPHYDESADRRFLYE